jgi:chromosome segregation ATPase
LAQRKEKEVDAPPTGRELGEAVDAAAKCLAIVQTNLAEVAEAASPIMQRMQESISALADAANFTVSGFGGEISRTQRLITDLAIEDVRRESEAESRHIQVEEGILDQLANFSKRLDKLENKPVQSNPELEDLRNQVAMMSNFLEQHKQTIEDFQTYSDTKLRQAVQKLDKKEGSHDG